VGSRCIRSAIAAAFILLLSGNVATATAAAAGGPGSLDQSFGEGGKVLTSFGWSYQSLTDVALQADGTIVAVGFGTRPGGKDVGIVLRYLPDGTLDRTFGGQGRVVLRTDHGAAGLFALAIQPDGRIVVVGRYGPYKSADFVVVRLNVDGSLDPSFGDRGIALTSFGDYAETATAVLVEPDGRIVAIGKAGTGPGPFAPGTFALARYLPDGSLDPTFGNGGLRTTRFPGKDTAASFGAVLGSDGSIIAVGGAGQPFDNPQIAVAKYRSNGSLDRRFGTDGRVLTDINGEAVGGDVVVQPDGAILVAGFASDGFIEGFALVRYLADGALDESFGSGGIVLTNFDHCNQHQCGSDGASALVLTPDGRIVVSGNGWAGRRPQWEFALARYLPDGSLDSSFGKDGLVLTPGTGGGAGMALQPDGRIVVAGDANSATSPVFALARYRGGS
jgi:uncharacterized delta-60 repeat protein